MQTPTGDREKIETKNLLCVQAGEAGLMRRGAGDRDGRLKRHRIKTNMFLCVNA